MSLEFETEQEKFWAGNFGDEYISRNKNPKIIASNVNFFVKALNATQGLKSVTEFGANIGLNLIALRNLYPDIDLMGVEINHQACEQLKKIQGITAFEQSLFDYHASNKTDLVLSKGVLIHLSPNRLEQAYAKLYESSKRYILIAEYYNPTPVEIPYRGFNGKLFKRDFAKEFKNQYPDLALVDYGFVYHDDEFPQDDLTWFLFEKSNIGS